MDIYSHIDSSILSAIRTLKEGAEIETITSLLLGICPWGEDNELISIFERLKAQSVLPIEKTPFHKFIVNNIFIKKTVDLFPDKNAPHYHGSGPVPAQAGIVSASQEIPQQVRDDTRGNDCISFGFNKIKDSKYEARFFWPSDLFPEVYDLQGSVFNKKKYDAAFVKDTYVLINPNFNIKIRKDELQIKNCIKNMYNVCQFKKKKKIKFPIRAEDIKDVLQNQLIAQSEVFQTPENFIMQLSDFPGVSCVEVTKKRHIRKMGEGTKIELAIITLQQKEWKTICIESNRLENVLALALLIDQKNAQQLSYDKFLQEQGSTDLEAVVMKT